MPNNCEGCPKICCQDFKITTEMVDPLALKRTLENFPFIHRTGFDIVYGPNSQEMAVGIYNCDRFQPNTGDCKNYLKDARPNFCYNTGNKSVPHSLFQLTKDKPLSYAKT